ncbi:MAG: DUF2550 domain-containing protein [Angustibacter sp.]
MDDLIIPLEVAAALVLLLLIALVAVVVRRRWLSRGLGAFDCSLRTSDRPHGKGWKLGVARYGPDEVEWFRVFDLSPRPRSVLPRAGLVVQDRRQPQGVEALAVMTGFVVVRCQRAGGVVELAMSEDSYTGFASWAEAGPPGQNVSVA